MAHAGGKGPFTCGTKSPEHGHWLILRTEELQCLKSWPFFSHLAQEYILNLVWCWSPNTGEGFSQLLTNVMQSGQRSELQMTLDMKLASQLAYRLWTALSCPSIAVIQRRKEADRLGIFVFQVSVNWKWHLNGENRPNEEPASRFRRNTRVSSRWHWYIVKELLWVAVCRN